MATIDPNIAMGYRAPQFESPLTQATQAAQLGTAQQQNMLGRMQMAEMGRAAQQKNQMREILANADPSSPEINNLLRKAYVQSGDIAGLMAHDKTVAEAQAARAKISESEAKTAQAKAGTATSEFELNKKKALHAWESVSKSTDPDEFKANIDDALSKKYITQEEANRGLAKLNAAIALDTAQGGNTNFMKLRMESLENLLPTLDAIKLKESKPEFIDVGDKKIRVETNPKALGYDAKLIELVKRPDITQAEIARHNKVMESQGRQRLANETNPNIVAQTVTDNAGNVTLLNKQGKVISTLEGKGKPSATFEKSAAQNKQISNDRKLAISELEEITKEGGLIDQSTSSYAGKGVDILARTIGTATPGDIAAGQLAPIFDLVLKMIPRFEGPQSDKDTASYNRAAGQLADTTLPAKIRKAAGKEILRLMKTRENQFQTPDMASGNVATPNAAPPAGFVPDN